MVLAHVVGSKTHSSLRMPQKNVDIYSSNLTIITGSTVDQSCSLHHSPRTTNAAMGRMDATLAASVSRVAATTVAVGSMVAASVVATGGGAATDIRDGSNCSNGEGEGLGRGGRRAAAANGMAEAAVVGVLTLFL